MANAVIVRHLARKSWSRNTVATTEKRDVGSVMSRIQLDFRFPGLCWSSAGRVVWILWLATVISIAICLVAPESALASGAIDAAIRPNLLLYEWFIALVFLGLGFLVLRKAICDRRIATATANWQTAPGTVITTDVTQRVTESDISLCYFVPQVRYDYDAYGVRRQGDVIRIGLDDTGYRKEKNARDHIAFYPVGTVITVHCNPQDPDQAVLEIGQVGVNRMMLVGAVLTGLGVAMFLFAIWSARLSSS